MTMRKLFVCLICFPICWVARLGWAQVSADDCLSEAGRDAETAIRYCSTAIDSGHLTEYELVHSLNSRGWAYYRNKDYDQAIQDYSRAVQLKPDYAFAFNNRGLAYFAKHDYDQAIKDYDEALRLKPDFALAFNNRGLAYVSKGDDDQAIQNFDKAVNLRGNNPQVFYNLGRAYAAQAHFDQAIKDYSHAIRLEPNYAEAFKQRSEAFMYKNDDESALRDISRAIEIQPGDADAISNRGSIFYQRRDYVSAIRDFTKAIQLKPDSVFTYWDRAFAYYDSGDYDAAIRDYNEVVNAQSEVNVKTVAEIYQRGLAYLYKGDYEEAILDFNEVANLKLSWGFYHRGLAHFFMGQLPAAKEDFNSSGESPYSDIWMFLAEAKLGENANEELQAKASRLAGQLNDWPGAVMRFYLGSITAEQLVAAARADDAADKNASACVCDEPKAVRDKVHFHYSEGAAYFYLGESMLLHRHSQAAAKQLFQTAVAMANRNSEEHHGAALELARMVPTPPQKHPAK